MAFALSSDFLFLCLSWNCHFIDRILYLILSVKFLVPHTYLFWTQSCKSHIYIMLSCFEFNDDVKLILILSFSQSEKAWPLKLGPIGCPEMSVWNYHSTLCKISKECGRMISGIHCVVKYVDTIHSISNNYNKFIRITHPRLSCFLDIQWHHITSHFHNHWHHFRVLFPWTPWVNVWRDADGVLVGKLETRLWKT